MPETRKITQEFMELQPAYGRDFRKAADAKRSFESGQDWIGDHSIGFAYCSVRDFQPGIRVLLRYSKLAKVVQVKVPTQRHGALSLA